MAIGWAGQRHRSDPSTLAERVVCAPWAAVLGSGTRVDADNRRTTNPLTGEPDAGNPPVRFGGRGKVQTLVPTPIVFLMPACGNHSLQLRPITPCVPSRLDKGRELLLSCGFAQ